MFKLSNTIDNNMILDKLKSIGLSEKEASVYLALVKYKELKAGKIARETSLPRPSVYSVLESLLQKGLVSLSLAGNVKYFSIEPITALEENIRAKEEEIKKYKQNMESVMSELHKIQENIDRPEVSFYEGKKAVNSLLLSTAARNKHIFEIGDWQIFAESSKKFIQERLKNRTTIDLIVKNSPQARAEKKLDKKILRKQYLISDKNFDAPAMIAVGDEHISMFTLEENHPIGIKIRNEKIVKTLQSLFKLAIKNQH